MDAGQQHRGNFLGKPFTANYNMCLKLSLVLWGFYLSSTQGEEQTETCGHLRVSIRCVTIVASYLEFPEGSGSQHSSLLAFSSQEAQGTAHA